MAYADALALPRISVDRWVSSDREGLEQNFNGMALEKVKQLLQTDKGKKELLQMMKQADPSLGGDVDKLITLVDGNVEQLEKKESFLKKVAMMPVRTLKAVGRTIVDHPWLSAFGAVAIIALLIYFFGPAAGTVGALREKATELFGEYVLKKVPVPTPTAGFGAAAEVPVGSGLLGPDAIERAAASAESAGTLMGQNLEAARSAGMSDQALKAISGAAEKAVQHPGLPGTNPLDLYFKNIAK